MASAIDRVIHNTVTTNTQALAEKLNLGPIGVLLLTRFSGPAILWGVRWARRNPALAIGSAALIGAGLYLQQKKISNAAHRIAAT